MAQDKEKTVANSAADWTTALKLSKKAQEKFEERGDKIVKRYRDDRGMENGEVRYNILWSNIRTLLPAVYGKKPKAQAERRHKDKDPVARAAAEILERCLQYEIDHYSDYDSGIKNAILDRLLCGRGAVWVRFESDETQITDDVEIEDDQVGETGTYEEKECSPTDYVFWKDFRHSPARTWEEVTWVARRVYMAIDEGVERFGETFKTVELTHVPIGIDKDDKSQEHLKKGIVWEIWDKATKKAYWVAEGHPTILDEKDDPLELDEFFPCPKPLFATLTTDDLIPVADYIMYQDQAKELDQITDRIGQLVDACKVVGVYDASSTTLSNMLEGSNNRMIAVSTWAMFAEKGGIKGAVDFFPLDLVTSTLQALYVAREQVKQTIYEVTGLSDIIRGASIASETATAQNIKSQYASLRLKEMQNDVARFASDLLRIKAQIICSLYSDNTIIAMSGIANTLDGQNQQGVMQALQLLKTDSLRNYSVEVASDSLVEIDEQGEKQSRMEFLQAAGGFIKEAVNVPKELMPLMGEMLMFGVRGFKAGRTIEGAFDEAMQALQAPKPPQESPEAAQQQADAQSKQAELQLKGQVEQGKAALEQQKAQFTSQLEQAKLQLEQAKQQAESDKTAQQLKLDRYKAELDSQTKLTIAEMQAQTSIKTSAMGAGNESTEFNDDGTSKPSSGVSSLVESMNNNMAALMQANMQSMADMQTKHADLVAAITRPKVGTLSNGKQIRIE
jgi:hypothetical protein